MKHSYIIIVLLLLFTGLNGCINDKYVDSGLSDGRFNGSLLEYMDAHSYDWSYTAAMVRHAGLENLFSGNDPDHKEITFFGPTNHTIRRYLLKNGYETVSDLPAEWCAKVLKACIVDGKIYRNDFVEGEPASGGNPVGDGGNYYTTLAGTRLWCYKKTAPYNGVEGIGPIVIYVTFLSTGKCLDVASSDIEPNNCVVQALSYYFTLNEFIDE